MKCSICNKDLLRFYTGRLDSIEGTFDCLGCKTAGIFSNSNYDLICDAFDGKSRVRLIGHQERDYTRIKDSLFEMEIFRTKFVNLESPDKAKDLVKRLLKLKALS